MHVFLNIFYDFASHTFFLHVCTDFVILFIRKNIPKG
jgi:hypothetical protein